MNLGQWAWIQFWIGAFLLLTGPLLLVFGLCFAVYRSRKAKDKEQEEKELDNEKGGKVNE